MIGSADYDIRYTVAEDAAFLDKWLSIPGMLELFPASNEKEKEIMLRFWMGFVRFRCSLTATFQNKPCGIGTLFLMPYRKVAHLSMLYLVVDPEFQQKGIGGSLLKNLKHLAKNYFRLEHLQMELFEGNEMMIRLLSHNGFSLFMRQEGFVKENGIYKARLLYKAYL